MMSELFRKLLWGLPLLGIWDRPMLFGNEFEHNYKLKMIKFNSVIVQQGTMYSATFHTGLCNYIIMQNSDPLKQMRNYSLVTVHIIEGTI